MTVDSQDTAVFAAISTWLKLTNPTTTQTNTLRSALKTWVALVNPPSPAVPNAIPETYTLAQGYGADALIGSVVTDIPATSFSIVSGDPNKYFAVWPSAHIRASEAGPIPPPGTYKLIISASNANGTGASAVYSIVCQGPVVIPPPSSSGFPNAIVGDPNGRPVMISSTVMAYTDGNGVAQQVTLTPQSGGFNITTDNTTIDALDITGGFIRIAANNCTISRCRITDSTDNLILVASGTGNVIKDCLINGLGLSGTAGSSGITCESSNTTVIRCNVFNCENGIGQLGNNDVVLDCYFHDHLAPGSPHYDGLQPLGSSDSNIIRHNTVSNTNTDSSCINLTPTFGVITNCLIDHNLILTGGVLPFPLLQDGTQSSFAVTANWTNNVIQHGSSGYDLIKPGAGTFTFNHSGNTDYNTGASIDSLL